MTTETEKVEVHLITLAVIDHEKFGLDLAKQILKGDSPMHITIVNDMCETKVIDFNDGHPINHSVGSEKAVIDLFDLFVPSAYSK